MKLMKNKENLFRMVIFLSSFLLFFIQPLIAKFFLPWFGGSSSVWAICLFYFTTMLLVGYLYAYLINKFSFYYQKLIHSVLILFALITIFVNWFNWGVPLLVDVKSVTIGLNQPFLQLTKSLFISIGVPYFILSSTAPLLQSWAHKLKINSVYRFYAISNAGSLIALLSFPFIIEPLLSLKSQAYIWMFLFCIFASLLIFISYKYSTTKTSRIDAQDVDLMHKITKKRLLSWTVFAFIPSFLLMATTSHLTQVVASVPFLWILPLVLYLFSFIIIFSGTRIDRGYVFQLLLIFTAVISFVFIQHSSSVSIVSQTIILNSYLFIASVFFHGLLYDRRPDESSLTLFYLIISFGGAMGTFFIAIISPLLFEDYIEFSIGLAIVFFMSSIYLFNEKINNFFVKTYQYLLKGILCLVGILIIYIISLNIDSSMLFKNRNFYGKIVVTEDVNEQGRIYRILSNGTTVHGTQLVADNSALYPLSYYALNSGVSVAFDGLRSIKDNLNVAVIGLGTGTIASYCRSGDRFDFYEIDPSVEHVAYEYFDYLDLCINYNIIIGDARLSLEDVVTRNNSSVYDLIVIDAFTDDAIPVHLLTKEAFEIYGSLLNPDGVLAVHISNRYLDLKGVVKGGVEHIGYSGFVYSSSKDTDHKIFSSTWAVAASKHSDLIQEFIKTDKQKSIDEINQSILWTDLYSNLFSVLNK